uniref:Uncharacterized protein n=1 Tax=Timema monikensis TaxID=170555 RepID=A0A7R9HUM5_9NEOP|nr:unnamed protein product [Timema monikensis]
MSTKMAITISIMVFTLLLCTCLLIRYQTNKTNTLKFGKKGYSNELSNTKKLDHVNTIKQYYQRRNKRQFSRCRPLFKRLSDATLNAMLRKVITSASCDYLEADNHPASQCPPDGTNDVYKCCQPFTENEQETCYRVNYLRHLLLVGSFGNELNKERVLNNTGYNNITWSDDAAEELFSEEWPDKTVKHNPIYSSAPPTEQQHTIKQYYNLSKESNTNGEYPEQIDRSSEESKIKKNVHQGSYKNSDIDDRTTVKEPREIGQPGSVSDYASKRGNKSLGNATAFICQVIVGTVLLGLVVVAVFEVCRDRLSGSKGNGGAVVLLTDRGHFIKEVDDLWTSDVYLDGSTNGSRDVVDFEDDNFIDDPAEMPHKTAHEMLIQDEGATPDAQEGLDDSTLP